MTTGLVIVFNMREFEITMTLDNSYEIVKIVTAKDEYNAISECRQLVKKEYNTKSIWFTNLKRL